MWENNLGKENRQKLRRGIPLDELIPWMDDDTKQEMKIS